MKPVITAIALCLLSSVLPSAAAAQGMVALELCEFRRIFREDFDTMSIAPRLLGSSKWTAHTPWNGDFGDAVFTDPAPAGVFSIKGGMLLITATKSDTGKWRSGLIAAADATGAGSGTRYGYFETRMKLPPGPGTWPAFWLATLKPATDKSPGIEIDALEYYGHSDAAFSSALHVWYKGADAAKSKHTVRKTPVPAGSLITGFHTYGVRVAPDVITYYFDRQPIWQMPTPAEHLKPLFPLVNLALGSGFPIDKTPNPSVLTVDYVNVYNFVRTGYEAACGKTARAAPVTLPR